MENYSRENSEFSTMYSSIIEGVVAYLLVREPNHFSHTVRFGLKHGMTKQPAQERRNLVSP